jgi:hypothetical protein
MRNAVYLIATAHDTETLNNRSVLRKAGVEDSLKARLLVLQNVGGNTMKQETEIAIEQPLPIFSAERIIELIKALDEKEMERKRGIVFSAEFLAEKVSEAKEKYAQLQKYPNSLVKGALLAVMQDRVVNEFKIE